MNGEEKIATISPVSSFPLLVCLVAVGVPLYVCLPLCLCVCAWQMFADVSVFFSTFRRLEFG